MYEFRSRIHYAVRFPATSRHRFMWIVRIALKRPYTFIVAALVIMLMTPIVLAAHAHRYFSRHRYSGVSICLELYRTVPAADGRPHRHELRALPDHGGGQHRAHRVADRGGPRRSSKSFFSPARTSTWRSRRSPPSRKPSFGSLPPGIAAPLIITYSASAVPILQLGLKGQGLSEQELFDYARELCSQPDGHRARRGDSLALRRKAAPGFGERGHSGAAGQRAFAGGCDQRHQPRRIWSCPPARSRWARPNSTWR